MTKHKKQAAESKEPLKPSMGLSPGLLAKRPMPNLKFWCPVRQTSFNFITFWQFACVYSDSLEFNHSSPLIFLNFYLQVDNIEFDPYCDPFNAKSITYNQIVKAKKALRNEIPSSPIRVSYQFSPISLGHSIFF